MLAATNPAAPPPAARDVTTATFMADVVEASLHAPVLVDFWAPWCGPCKQLGPLLEKAVAATKGKVRMVKVNIDAEPQLAASMRVQSIPAVFAFADGQPVDGFVGALPESQLTAFVQKIAGLSRGGDSEANLASMLEQADAFLSAGQPDHAAALYGEILESAPANPVAYTGHIKALLALKETEAAAELAQAAPPEVQADKSWSAAQTALALAAKAAQAGPVDALAAKVAATPTDPQVRYDYAMALYAGGDAETAMAQLIELVRRNRAWNDEQARRELVSMFEALGGSDVRVITARRALSSVLFA